MKQRVVFPSLGSANAQQLVDHVQNVHNKKGGPNHNPAWEAGTLRWAIPVERLDGDWDFPVLQGQTYPPPFRVEDYDPENYPEEE